VSHYGCANKGVSVPVAPTANGRDSCLQEILPRVGRKVYARYLGTMGTSHLIRSRSRWGWTRHRASGFNLCYVQSCSAAGVAST
jgi:hypothetical protein